jgi:hypothetical protein
MAEQEQVTQQEEQTNEEVPTTVEPVTLNMTDLQALAQCVDLGCRRGAYQGAEMSTVGAVYDKLKAFLDQVAAAAEAESTGEEEGTEEQ